MDPIERRRRKPKSTLSAWIVTQRESQPTADGRGWKSEELARRLGVSDSTVRGWEAGRSVSEANLAQLERVFGVTAPGRDEAPSDLAALIAEMREQNKVGREQARAIEAQADAINRLVDRLELAERRPLTPQELQEQTKIDEAVVEAFLREHPEVSTRLLGDTVPAGESR